MKTSSLQALLIVSAALSCSISQAAIIQFDLQGTGGIGLLNTNEPGSPVGGTGGEIGAGISYDDVANLLTLNVGWGSSQGFTNLSSSLTAAHIHGPTASNNGAGFTQTSGVAFGLTPSSTTNTGGFFADAPILFSAGQEIDLLNGKFYINIHTSNNGGGELRGFLVQAAPEPTSLGLLAVGALGLLTRRKRQAA